MLSLFCLTYNISSQKDGVEPNDGSDGSSDGGSSVSGATTTTAPASDRDLKRKAASGCEIDAIPEHMLHIQSAILRLAEAAENLRNAVSQVRAQQTAYRFLFWGKLIR